MRRGTRRIIRVFRATVDGLRKLSPSYITHVISAWMPKSRPWTVTCRFHQCLIQCSWRCAAVQSHGFINVYFNFANGCIFPPTGIDKRNPGGVKFDPYTSQGVKQDAFWGDQYKVGHVKSQARAGFAKRQDQRVGLL